MKLFFLGYSDHICLSPDPVIDLGDKNAITIGLKFGWSLNCEWARFNKDASLEIREVIPNL